MRMGSGFVGLPKGCLFSDVTGGIGTFGSTRPRTTLVQLKVNSIAHPLPPTSVGTVRHTMSRLTSTKAFRKCNPRRKCSFLVRTVLRRSCHSHKMRLHPARVFIDSKTGDSANGFKSVLNANGGITMASPICPICVSDGIVTKETKRLRTGKR